MEIYYQRIIRLIREFLLYPIWLVRGRGKADNGIYKMKRIKKLAKKYSCSNFIETGTFYGQTVSFASKIFKSVVSIEIYEPFYKLNDENFKDVNNVSILLGDSLSRLPEAIKLCDERVLFWLDGHYSGEGTGIGDATSPILGELDVIKDSQLKSAVIVIDDLRLFTGKGGYPTIYETLTKLHAINHDGLVLIDSDAIVFIYNKV